MRATEFLIIVPQAKEYEAVKAIFSVPQDVEIKSLKHGGTYVLHKVGTESGGRPFHVAISCINDMYNYPCLSRTVRLLLALNPKYVFLIGSACGVSGKVKVCNLVVSNGPIAYLGRERLVDQSANPRPYTLQIGTAMRDALNDYMNYRNERFDRWNKLCRRFLNDLCPQQDRPPDLEDENRNFEIMTGVLASDDMVLSWSNEDAAKRFWGKRQDDAKAYDMESAGFSYACSERGDKLQWTVVRGISDLGVRSAPKYHFAAAIVAALWLRGFIQHLAKSTLGKRVKWNVPDKSLRNYNWKGLYDLLDNDQTHNIYVGKRRFIREKLKSNTLDIQALFYATLQGGIVEYRFYSQAHLGHTITAIRLDKKSDFWYDIGVI